MTTSSHYDKFRRLLAELFMFDQADLDFGIYRIMNANRGDIERFLDRDLLPQVRNTLGKLQGDDRASLEAELHKAIEAAKSLGVDPESSPKVQQLRGQLAEPGDLDALEAEVFSELYNFFRRYYREGDFISQRRYKEGVYAIPYEGEEVKLHWANHDQYYIKSTENFRDYTFKLRDGRRVHFKLADADTERDNNRAANGNDRRFILCEDDPLVEQDGELVVRFEYRPDGEGRKQDPLNTATRDRIFAAKGFAKWTDELMTKAPAATNPNRTLLERHLTEYTARNTFDYFIHKNLGAFLRRELDFYVKNEIVHLDDIENESAPRVEQYLAKVRAIRRIAHKIIDFLAHIEDFQKKLWLKKKFVVETNYCITLDRVPEKLYPEILANDAQREEWVRLFAVDSIQEDLVSPGYSVPLTLEFLQANRYLVLDTRHFAQPFVDSLLRSITDLETSFSGLVIKSDNFHGLALLAPRYRSQIKAIYIDPPYNTGLDEFVYKDNYQRSSWIAMMEGRLRNAEPLLSDNGIFLCSLDDGQSAELKRLFADRVTTLRRLGEFVWKTRNTDNRVVTNFSVDHESVHVFSRPDASLLGRVIDRSSFKNPDNDPRGPYTTDPLTGKANATDRPNLHYMIVNPKTGDEYPPHPDFGWITNEEGFRQLLADNRIAWPANPKTGQPRKKRFLSETNERAPISSLAISITQGEGNRDLAAMFGEKLLNFPKPVSVIRTLLDCSAGDGDTILDYFAGSGTTGQAAVRLIRNGCPSLHFVLIEMAEYFDELLVPRVKKAVYSNEWEEGKPKGREGVSIAFKYLRLESYEDALNNLVVTRRQDQKDLLDNEPALREDYTLRYMLDEETKGSPSLLNVRLFEDPFNYRMKIATGTVGETKDVAVDLVETFNWLLGLSVKHIDTIRGVRVVEGKNPDGERVLVIWRNTKEIDSNKLDEWFTKQGYNTRDQEYDIIYVNGDNNVENLRRADQTWKVRITEDEFHRLMFDVQDV